MLLDSRGIWADIYWRNGVWCARWDRGKKPDYVTAATLEGALEMCEVFAWTRQAWPDIDFEAIC